MDFDESSDILGRNTKLPMRAPVAAASSWPGVSKMAFYVALLLMGYLGVMRVWARLGRWREKSHRLATRRRFGIPDHDHRPFNVAHAAALRAHRESEVANNGVERVDVDALYAQAAADREGEGAARQRKPTYANTQPSWASGGSSGTSGLPGKFSLSRERRHFPVAASGAEISSPFGPRMAHPSPAVRFAERSSHILSSPKKQKRTLDEQDHLESDEPEHPKKTRVEGEEFIDGDEAAEWIPRHHKRGSKRVSRDQAVDEDQDAAEPIRGKRARKVSLEKDVAEVHDVDMDDGDDGDGDNDMQVDPDETGPSVSTSSSRGKKRTGREVENDEESGKKAKRKRRSARKSDGALLPVTLVPSRGQKRDRDRDGDEASDDEVLETPGKRKTKKRGKKGSLVPVEDDGGVSSPAKGKQREIGEEWESNGVYYKVGQNGQRMRQALVKKAAKRFNMPLDSEHPDRDENLEVCVEMWLTDEEYDKYKAQSLLAWQDSPKAPQPAPAAEVPMTPTPITKPGKNLLWDSPVSPFPNGYTPSPVKEVQPMRFRQSIASDLGVRMNPFDRAELLKTGGRMRRLGGLRNETGTAGANLVDSTNNVASRPSPRRAFSKWEKQDLEAKAMLKMREVNQARLKEKEKEKLAVATVPTIAITAPEPAKAVPAPAPAPEGASKSPFSFGSAPAKDATASSPAAQPGPGDKPAGNNFFSLGAPKTVTPAADAAKPNAAAAVGKDLFAAPPAKPGNNFFAAPATAAAKSSSPAPAATKPATTNFFAAPAAAPTAPKLPAANNFFGSPTPGAASAPAPAPGVANPFPSAQVPQVAKTSDSAFGFGQKVPVQSPAPAASPFGFGQKTSAPASAPSAPGPASTAFGLPQKAPAPAPSGPAAPTFSFGQKATAPAPAPPAPASGGSLLSRMAGKPAEKAGAGEAAKSAFPSSAPKPPVAGGSAFAPPAGSAFGSTTNNAFGVPAAKPQPAALAAPVPVKAAPVAAPAAGADATATATPSFSFKAVTANAKPAATKPAAAATTVPPIAEAPNFAFGGGSGFGAKPADGTTAGPSSTAFASAFGAGKTAPLVGADATKPAETTKPAVAFGDSASPFGAKPADTESAFGKPAQSAFGKPAETANVFGGKAAETPSVFGGAGPASVFGSQPAAISSLSGALGDPKPFAFGSGGAADKPATTGFSFSNVKDGEVKQPPANAFGGAVAGGFGSTPATTPTTATPAPASGFSFGAAATAPPTTAPAPASAFKFGGAATPASSPFATGAFGSTTAAPAATSGTAATPAPAAASTFAFGGSTTPAGSPFGVKPGAFGAGTTAPAPVFSFGSNSTAPAAGANGSTTPSFSFGSK
ncbi:unnamed protein product [Mycena citricolor]|uniref:Uncharacterized protein n=1 Tax=Mycena citricolor TaxID=2018698 RepID=A0AAD2JVQ6_9AGAR|nr:unnamed protein product [Mycena citricolor]